MVEAEVRVMCFEDGRRDQDPKNVGGFQNPEKVWTLIFPWSLQKEYNSTDILLLAHMIHFILVTSRAV